MSSALRGLCFHDPRAFVIGAEHLTETGMTDEFAGWLAEERGLGGDWRRAFDRAFAGYRERARALAALDPEVWFPPRKQNICVVVDAERTRPYYLPFNKASWLVYADDFAPDESPELAIYLLLHTERLCLTQSPTAAVAHNLGYWLQRSEAEIAGFASGAERSRRPDAEAFRALAQAQAWIGALHHPTLRPLAGAPDEPLGRIPNTGLLASRAMQPHLIELVRAFRETTAEVARRYFAAWEGEPAPERVTGWLREAAPRVLVTGESGAVLWDPDAPGDVAAANEALADVPAAVAESIRADIETVDRLTTRFLGALRDPASLPLPGGDIEQTGLSYIHATRRLIAYNLLEADMHRTREPAAPYERLMLAARTVHEWAHLAVDAGLVCVPESRQSEHARAVLAFTDALADIVKNAPPELAEVAEHERALTGSESLAVGLRDVVLGRMPDYLANLLARRVLDPLEMETYVRQQVTSLAQENLGPFGQIARHAFELQYLSLGSLADPMGYFLDTTWFADTFIAGGIVTRARFEALVEAMARISACVAIDEAEVSPGARA